MKSIKYSIVFLLAFVSFTLSSQESKPGLAVTEFNVEDNSSASRGVVSKLQSRLKKDYTILSNAFLQLSGGVSFGEMHTINGMDTYTTTEATVSYTIKGDGIPSADISLPLKCKGNSERDLIYKLGTTIIRDSKHYDALADFIDGYVQKAFGSCASVTSAISKQLSGGNTTEAYTMLGYYDLYDGCEAEQTKQEDLIVAKHAEVVCASVIQKAEVLANSGIANNLTKAIDLLAVVPPDAPCAKDAIRVSEIVGENAKVISQYSAQKVQDRIVIMNSMNHTDWKQWYRNNYTKVNWR